MYRGRDQLGLVDFADFETGQRQNVFVMLPEGFESTVDADDTSPVFNVAAAALLERFKETALRARRTELVETREDGGQLVFRQRSKTMRYPDYLTVEAVAAGDGKASLCIFSRSKYGIRDFGVNERRVKNWIARTEAAVDG